MIKTLLKNRIFSSFRELGQFLDLIPTDPNDPSNTNTTIPDPYLREVYEQLRDVSGVLDCLGAEVIDELTTMLGTLLLLLLYS